MKIRIIVAAGLAITMMAVPFIHENISAAKEKPVVAHEGNKQEISNKEVLKLVQQWVEKRTYIQNGGAYGEGEYKSFQLNDTFYRYLSKDIDTKKEIMDYLTESTTRSYAEKYLKDIGIIEHKKRLAQVEADGGSLLQWDQASVKYSKMQGVDRVYLVTVPVGETEEFETYSVSVHHFANKGWKINDFEIYEKANS
ncbi:DL-endopeptidase inhibitor IseA family protein [Robertmurraya andreesenii]|uniref:Uncharacterized protein n=1 Tax=Anoxybacillus andreesenii TaxID=1325932 RepID=A0ABT9UZH4_9BACL|nr:DL-endopeptidase inhibitor IseA family protein [Robertmurraya andreesenii]MDQ0154050.1 hypothetical protein [Robertmurraya andreesenii]